MNINDDNIPQEEKGGRRTRSGRKSSSNSLGTPAARSTRRSTRKQIQEQTNDTEHDTMSDENLKIVIEEERYDPSQSDIIKEMLAEAAQGVIIQDDVEYLEASSNDQITIAEEIICEIEEDPQVYHLENSAMEEQDYCESITTAQEEVDDDIEMVVIESDQIEEVSEQAALASGIMREITPMEHIVEDENGSSFPFGGSVQQSENSIDNKIEPNSADMADSSIILASMAGDNANSLPSVGEESQSKENFEDVTDEVILDNSQENLLNDVYDADDSHSENAIAEDLPNGSDDAGTDYGAESDKTLHTVDAEMVSEDELQTPPSMSTNPKVNDAEEVSDDELPAPERAELPADTEVVSEDELPSNGSKKDIKRKASPDEEYNPNSPTGEESNDAAPEKKVKLAAEEGIENEELKEKKKEKKKLPDLDKYWKTVKDDPSDFTGWTYLLQYVDQETDVEAAREAYDAFLGHYPYCYGYWRKYADYEKRKGDREKCYEVFERGLKSIPLSVDLWIHYLSHVKNQSGDNEDYIRSQFTRAVEACGLEFRSDKLWEAFIKWELEEKRYGQIIKIYDKLLSIPTQGYNGHFDSFQDIITNNPANVTVSVEEFKKLRAEVRETADKAVVKLPDNKEQHSGEVREETVDASAVTVEEVVEEADDHVRNDEEMTAIKDKIISIRRKTHKATIAAVTARWTFEEGIKRPYFHVKPLERSQLKNWKEYLDFEIEKGDRQRVLILFERCLIACALYDEFWLKLIRYLETENDPELVEATRDAYTRSCTIHHPDKPSLHLMWSAFEECQNDFDKASDILIKLDERCPNLLQIAYRRINLERRRGNLDKCKELYEFYIGTAKSKNVAGSLAIKYARFCHKILKDIDLAIESLKQTLEKDTGNTRVALQMIDLALQREIVDENEIVEIMDKFVGREGVDPDQKVLFAQRKVEFLEDFGCSAKGLQEAQRTLQLALNKANEAKKKNESSPNPKATKDTKPTTSGTAVAVGYPSNTSYYGNATASASQTAYYNTAISTQAQAYQQQQQQAQQPSYDGYGYNHWQYGSGYSGYGQWSGYGNYY